MWKEEQEKKEFNYNHLFKGLRIKDIFKSSSLKRTKARLGYLRVRNVLLTIFHGNIKILEILICLTNQHQKYDILHV